MASLNDLKSIDPFKIQIFGWDNYNQCERKEGIQYTWYRVDNNHQFNEKIIRLSDAAYRLYFSLLSIASDQNLEIICTNLIQIRTYLRQNNNKLRATLNQICNVGLIQVLDITQNELLTYNKTDKTNKQDKTVMQKKKISFATHEINNLSWKKYSDAYERKYGAAPIRNFTTNRQIKQLVEKLGNETPDVLEFYLSHPKAYYLERGHGLGIALVDAEKLRMEWITGNQITSRGAREIEKNHYEENVVRNLVLEGVNENAKSINGRSNKKLGTDKGNCDDVQDIQQTDRRTDFESVDQIALRLINKWGKDSNQKSDQN